MSIDIGWLVLMIPAWALLIGVLDFVLFAPQVKCPVCKEKLKPRWWWFIIPTTVEFLMLVAGFVIGRFYQ